MALWTEDDIDKERSKSGRGITKLLLVILCLLVAVLAAGTVYGLASGARQKKLSREADRAQVASELAESASYTAIGTVRAKSADEKSAVVVATIAFPYDSNDKGFSEELARKAPVLKAAAESVLSSRKAADLAPAFEGAVKAELRDAFNSRLSLGKVGEIWLSDFSVIQ